MNVQDYINETNAVAMHESGEAQYGFVEKLAGLDRADDEQSKTIRAIVSGLELILVKRLNPTVVELIDILEDAGFDLDVRWSHVDCRITVANPYYDSKLGSTYGVGFISKYLGEIKVAFDYGRLTFRSAEYQFVGTPRRDDNKRYRSTTNVVTLVNKAKKELYLPTREKVQAVRKATLDRREQHDQWAADRQVGELLSGSQTRELFELVLNSNIELPESLKPAFAKYLELTEGK